MSRTHDDFPLATGLSHRLAAEIEAIAGGAPSELLERVTPVTAELLRFWFQEDFCDVRRLNFHAGQRSAILHVIYAHEVLGARRLQDLYRDLAPEAMLEGGTLSEVTRRHHDHPKYCAKMATGTGKTWVLNALLVWQYLNSAAAPEDDRFTRNFLLVAPGLIVYDRLLDSFMGRERDGERDFSTSDIHGTQELFVPDNFRESVFGFLQSAVVTKTDIGKKVTGGGMIALTNWHLLAGQEDPDFLSDVESPGEDVDPKEAVESFFPVTPGKSTDNSLEVLDRRFLRGGALSHLVDLKSLMVFNDEAHHIHDIRKGGEVTEVEWQKSLNEIAATKAHRFVQVDFSATPYNQVGSGKNKGKQFFPHIVVDFDLASAMGAGLVKSLALDKRSDVAALPLDFKAERDEQKQVTGLSNGQRVMLRAGLRKLQILEDSFKDTDSSKHPKLLVVCEETSVTGHVVEFLKAEGLSDEDVLAVDSNRNGEMNKADWDATRERLFDVDRHSAPRVIVSVLMLREGFDVNNICVIVPLRSSAAQILLEQTIGRGLRLMWRGDERVDELKEETRSRFRQGLEPTNFFDVLFIVEHPAFSDFYDDLLTAGLAGEVVEGSDSTSATGDLMTVELRDGYEQFDFAIPLVVREAEEELAAPVLDPLGLARSRYPLDMLKGMVGKGDKFISEDAQTKTQYGDYRVHGGVMTATGYNDYLSRMTTRISEALGSSITQSAKSYSQASRFPLLQTFRPQLTGWIDTYIRQRMFDEPMNPLEDENWRVLLIDDVAHGIAGAFATALTEAAVNQSVAEGEVTHRWLSEVAAISARSTSVVEVNKCIYPMLPIPARAGGLERKFAEWADRDSKVAAFAKIDEYRHDFLHRPYLKADGMPAYYSPDFIVRDSDTVFIVETKSQGALSDANVERKQTAALAWVEQLSQIEPEDRDNREWYYVLLGEGTFEEWRSKNASLVDLLNFARLRRSEGPRQESLL